MWSFRGLAGVVSSALGGGSHIYANVLLRMPEKWFVTDDPTAEGGYRPWPITRADLEPHYDEVERMLAPQQFPFNAPGYEASGKTAVMRRAASTLGLESQLPPLAVTFTVNGRTEPGVAIPDPPYGNIHGRQRTTCRLVGECDIGCQYGSKNSLDHTYLSAAAHYGADLRTWSEVRSFEPTGHGWAVHYVTRNPEHEGRRIDAATLPITTITCDRLLLGAGTFGTTYLLLRNRSALPGLGPLLGHRFCGNGDLLGFVFGARDKQGQVRRLGSSAAPVITSAIQVPDTLDGGNSRGYYIEDAGYPGFLDWLVEASDVPGISDRVLDAAHAWLLARLMRNPKTRIAEPVSRVLGSGTRSAGATALLGMGRDIPDGVMRLRGPWLDVDWTTRTSQQYFDRVHDTMRQLAQEFGGCFEPNPLSWLNRVITVHPLGGAPMGNSVHEGVVDPYGEVFGHPGLFVVDGSVMPGPIGANPCLTISAFADRVATAILEGRTAGPSVSACSGVAVPDRCGQTVPAGPDVCRATGKTAFGEKLKGHLAFDVSDPDKGAEQGKLDGTSIVLHLRVIPDDHGGLTVDPRQEKRLTGWVDCDALGGRLSVSDGRMTLVDRADTGSLRVRYRLFLTDSVGYPLTLAAWRNVRQGSVLDVWHDVITRPFLLLAGHVESQRLEGQPCSDAPSSSRIVGAGVVSLRVPDLARSLIGLRPVTDPLGQIRTLVEAGTFATHVLGSLWRVYRPNDTHGHGQAGHQD